MLLAADQGAVVTLNGGETWSSWYNQPTAQLYHVAADNAFPYRVCSGQQESGSACVSSRGNYGAISDRDWLPVGVDEYGYVAPDPLDPGHRLRRAQRDAVRPPHGPDVQTVGPDARARGGQGTFRIGAHDAGGLLRRSTSARSSSRTTYLWKTTDGGAHWTQISPRPDAQDVGDRRRASASTASDPSAKPQQRGVIYTIAPSYQDMQRIWVGTDDGLIHVDRRRRAALEGRDAARRSPPWAKVSIIDAGRFSPLTAYAAVNTLRLDDMRPHIYRTHDGGKTWTEIVTGIPDGETVNVVREDPRRKGLLFAGTERDGLRVVRRRRPLAVAAPEHGGLVGARPDRQRRRPGGGHARPRVLDPRRHHAAAADRRGVGGRRRHPLQADDGVARAVEHEHRHAVAQGRADRQRTRPTARSSTTT